MLNSRKLAQLSMQITKNFTLEELIKSNTAKLKGIVNTPTTEAIINLTKMCVCILQPARDEYGKPIIISSGFRNRLLNQAVGGVPVSYHLKGSAVDILVADKYEARRLANILNKQRNCDVVLWENHAWLHVQYSDKPRHHINLSYS